MKKNKEGLVSGITDSLRTVLNGLTVKQLNQIKKDDPGFNGVFKDLCVTYLQFNATFKDMRPAYYSQYLRFIALKTYLESLADSWGWTKERQGVFGSKIKTFETVRGLWDEDPTPDISKFGEVRVLEAEPIDFTKPDYKIWTNEDLIPETDLRGMSFLNAILLLIKKVEELSMETERQFIYPGLEFQQHLSKNPDTIPDNLKGGNRFYYPGSSFRDNEGGLSAPCSFSAGFFDCIRYFLDRSCGSVNRFIILEILKPEIV